MLSPIVKRSTDLSCLSPLIYSNKELSDNLENSVRLLQDQWLTLKSIFEEQLLQSPDLLLSTLSKPADQQRLIHQFAKNAFFFKRSITWIKKCDPSNNGGHHVRINPKALTEKEANKLMDEYTEILTKNPTVKEFKTWKEKIQKKNKFDVRITIIHKDNAPECNFLPQEELIDKAICVADVLKDFDNEISNSNLNRSLEYAALFSLITQTY